MSDSNDCMPNCSPVEEAARMMRFLADKSKNVTSPINCNRLWKEYAEKYKTNRKVDAIRTRFRRHLASGIWELKNEEFDEETKVKMIFATRTPIKDIYLQKLQESAEVEVDKLGRITKYKASHGGLELVGDNSEYDKIQMSRDRKRRHPLFIDENSGEIDEKEEGGADENMYSQPQESAGTSSIHRTPSIIDDDVEMMNFVGEAAKHAEAPISMRNLWKRYKEIKQSTKKFESLDMRFRQNLAPMIHKLTNVDVAMKVRMLFVTSTPVDEVFLQNLRNNATVEIDQLGRIKIYKSNEEGGLYLFGKHRNFQRPKKYKPVEESSTENPIDFKFTDDIIKKLTDILNQNNANATFQGEEEEEELKLFPKLKEPKKEPSEHSESSTSSNKEFMSIEEYLKFMGGEP